MSKYIANPVEINAQKIIEVSGGSVLKAPSIKLEDGSVVELTLTMVSRMDPVVGDYLVIQEDGYMYLNPKDVFERKYKAKEN